MKKLLLALFLTLSTNMVLATEVSNLSADEALKTLKSGNERFARMHLSHPHVTTERLKELTTGQHPFVIILSCSDSRVPPELIFDQGLGDIFEIRNAGNVLDEHVIGSIEYAIHHLGVNLVIVLGHESCGAIAATMQEHSKETPAIESLKKAIKPACAKCKKEHKYTAEEITKTHAKLNVKTLLNDKKMYTFANVHNVKFIPAYYSLTTGKVEFFD